MGSLRIVAGRFRGRRLSFPDHPALRPTADRVREALFNILGQDLGGRAVLDLFAGTGASGLEAISRGAARAVFVEAEPRLAKAIRAAAESWGVEREARIVVGRVQEVLDLERLGGPFDVILADPPYAETGESDLVARIESASLLAPRGVLVVERESRLPPTNPASRLALRRTASYGRTALDFFDFP